MGKPTRSSRSGKLRPADPMATAAGSSVPSDSRVVDLVRSGQTEAFGLLVRRYEAQLQRMLYRFVYDREAARDLAQETFLRAFERLEQFDPSHRFGPWLFRIGLNLAVDWLRQGQRTVRTVPVGSAGRNLDVAAPDPQPGRELAQEVHRVLEQLPIAYRTVLVLRDLQGFSSSEVAAIEGRRESTIRWRLAVARDMFRQLWEKRQGVENDRRNIGRGKA